MIFSILLLIAVFYISYRVSPRERQEDAHVHGAGQVGLLAAVALFGVDYFTSYYYATGEMMSALHLRAAEVRLYRCPGDRAGQLRLWSALHVLLGCFQ
jgi:hypothetical protein